MKYLFILSVSFLLTDCSGNAKKETAKKDTVNSHLPTEPFPTDNQYKDSIKRPASDSAKRSDHAKPRD